MNGTTEFHLQNSDKSLQSGEIAQALRGTLVGNDSVEIDGAASLEEATERHNRLFPQSQIYPPARKNARGRRRLFRRKRMDLNCRKGRHSSVFRTHRLHLQKFSASLNVNVTARRCMESIGKPRSTVP